MIQLDEYILDDIVSDINPKVTKIGLNKNRALNGTLWTDFTIVKHTWELVFEDITQEQRDTLLSKFVSISSHTFKYLDGVTYNVQFIDNEWAETLMGDDFGNIFYTIKLNIEEI